MARSAAIEVDLLMLSPDAELPLLLPEGVAYADRVRRASVCDGSGLLGHPYVRYLGDLNGGGIMQQRRIGCFGDVATGLTFGVHITTECDERPIIQAEARTSCH